MKYTVRGDGSFVKITVRNVGSKRADLMRELTECAEGRCACPTPQYAKVASMQIEPGNDQLSMTVTAKPGETIDRGDLETCLEHTTRKVTKPA